MRLVRLLTLSALLATFASDTCRAQVGVRIANSGAAATGWCSIPDHPALRPQTFTLELWFTALGPGYGQTMTTGGANLIGKPMQGQIGNGISSWFINWSPQTGSLVAGVAEIPGISFVTLVSTKTVAQGTATHVALTFDGQEATLLIDGCVDGSAAFQSPVSLQYGPEEILIGGANFCCGFLRGFDGLVDGVRIWDHVRTERQLRNGWCGTLGPRPALLAQWDFDGGTVQDSSGNAHHGTIVGTAVSFAPYAPTCMFNYPGTAEDLCLSLEVGGNQQAGPGRDQVLLNPGETVRATLQTPNATFFGEPYFLGLDLFIGAPIGWPGIPELHLSPSVIVLASGLLPAGPVTSAPLTYGGGFSGISLLFQGVAISSASRLGLFAATDGYTALLQ